MGCPYSTGWAFSTMIRNTRPRKSHSIVFINFIFDNAQFWPGSTICPVSTNASLPDSALMKVPPCGAVMVTILSGSFVSLLARKLKSYLFIFRFPVNAAAISIALILLWLHRFYINSLMSALPINQFFDVVVLILMPASFNRITEETIDFIIHREYFSFFLFFLFCDFIFSCSSCPGRRMLIRQS